VSDEPFWMRPEGVVEHGGALIADGLGGVARANAVTMLVISEELSIPALSR